MGGTQSDDSANEDERKVAKKHHHKDKKKGGGNPEAAAPKADPGKAEGENAEVLEPKRKNADNTWTLPTIIVGDGAVGKTCFDGMIKEPPLEFNEDQYEPT